MYLFFLLLIIFSLLFPETSPCICSPDIQQMRGPFSRESSHQPHDPRQRYSESPKKSSSLAATKRASKGHVPGENKDKEGKNGKKEEEEKTTEEDENKDDTTEQQLILPSGQSQELQKESSELSQNSEPQETSTKDQETGEETHQQLADSEDVCGTIPSQSEGVARDSNEEHKEACKGAEEEGDINTVSGDPHASPRSLEGGSVTEGRVEEEDGAGKEVSASTDTRLSKDPSHRLSLPLNELIRSVLTTLSIKI